MAVGVGAVYLTVDQGVWSSPSDSSQALDKMRTKVLPDTNYYWEKVCHSWPTQIFAYRFSCCYLANVSS